jgi:DNA repair exonuclease SbcCD ATPase subunit
MTGSEARKRGEGEADEPRGLRQRLSNQAEETVGRLADDLLDNPVVNSALSQAASGRERMAQAQEAAMDALNLPSASNLEKLTRRLRSVSQRLEQIEEAVDRLDRRMESVSDAGNAAAEVTERLDRLDSRLEELGRDLVALRRDLVPRDAVPEVQPRAAVPEG